MRERKHIINILEEVQKALKREDYSEIRALSNTIIHQASIEQDPDIISLAVIIYSLSKILEREEYKKQKNWTGFSGRYIKSINNLIILMRKDDIGGFRSEIELIRKLIDSLSGNLKAYISDVFRKAQINKASKIYEHGISMEKTAKILGISVWELAEYAGKVGIGDVNLGITMLLKKRIKLAEETFE
ncbi:MAG: hypothetical protein WC438_03800 [Candidatus Pacearchaeota archaeon]